MDTNPDSGSQRSRKETPWLARLMTSPRAVGLLVTLMILVTLGVGALADTLATAPLRPATRVNTTKQAGIYMLTLSVNPEPLRAGQPTTFTVQAKDATGMALTKAQASCNFTMPAMPMPLMVVTARLGAPGTYICPETLTATGAWTLMVTLTPAGDPAIHTTFALQAG